MARPTTNIDVSFFSRWKKQDFQQVWASSGEAHLHRLVELTRLKLATTRKEEKERSRISPLQICIILIIMIDYSHHRCHCCHHHGVHQQQSHQLTHQKYSYVSCRLLRGVNDPDILVKRPAESPGGMTVTIFKVGIMDSVIVWSGTIPFLHYFHYFILHP